MEWYHYVSAFFSGLFFANFVPHFVTGICGNAFPTPFAKPRGRGLSSPVVNVAWGLFNLVAGFLLFKRAKISFDNDLLSAAFFAGIVLISFFLAVNFAKKEKTGN
jgi:hypothetical protein